MAKVTYTGTLNQLEVVKQHLGIPTDPNATYKVISTKTFGNGSIEADRKALTEGNTELTIELDFGDIKELLKPAPKNVVGKTATVKNVGTCMSGFNVGDFVEVIGDDKGGTLPYQILNITNGYNKGTIGYAEKEDIKFIGGGF